MLQAERDYGSRVAILRYVRHARCGLAGLAVVLCTVPATAQAQSPPCSAEWEARYSPALEIADLGKRIAVGREMEFSFIESQRRGSAVYRPRLGSFVGINSGPRDREPYFKAFTDDITRGAFAFTPGGEELGRTYTAGVGWTEEEPVAVENPQTCLRTATGRARVIRGFPPRIKVTNERNLISFAVRQRRGAYCEQTRRGAVRIIVRGPGGTRRLRLGDTCGKWTKGVRGRGWRLRRDTNYYADSAGDYPVIATLTSHFRTPGTRIFRYRITFRRRTVQRGAFETRVRVCNVNGCQG